MGCKEKINGFAQKVNNAVGGSFVGRFFKFEDRETTFVSELRGATATFLTMAYILAVNPSILSDSGGPCVAEDGNIFSDTYNECVENIRRQYVTATAIGCLFGCLAMGLLANLPIALAPGMGMNAYFTYSVVGFRGTGNVSFQAAITAIMIEGAIFLFLALTGIRYAIIRLVPEPVRHATPAAIGVFLAHLGLQTAEGIGVVVSDVATAVTLGACPPERRTPMVALTEACAENSDMCIVSDAYTCDVLGGVMTSARTWVGILGLMIMAIMLSYKNRSAFICGIGFITFISWFRGTAITYFPDTPGGDARFEYFKQVVNIEPVNALLAQFTNQLGEVGIALITFLYVDFLDTSGTLLGLAHSLKLVDEEGNFPRSRAAFCADALATMFGSIFGLSPVTSYIESASGVEAGSRTGCAAVLCGFYFFLSIFFAPIIASIPPWATGGALIIVGALMCRSLGSVKWWDLTHAITAFLTVIVMTLTYSIAYGLIAGIGAYLVMHGAFWILSLVGVPKPIFTNPDDFSEEPEVKVHVTDGGLGEVNDVEEGGLDETKDVKDDGIHDEDMVATESAGETLEADEMQA